MAVSPELPGPVQAQLVQPRLIFNFLVQYFVVLKTFVKLVIYFDISVLAGSVLHTQLVSKYTKH